MTLTQLVGKFITSRLSGGLVLSESEVTEVMVKAVCLYAGYATLRFFQSNQTFGTATLAEIDPTIVILTMSEWAIIQPLFNAYVDHENALRLEASRGLGMDVFGRSVSEIAGDIRTIEMDLPRKAFYQAIVSVGNLDVYST